MNGGAAVSIREAAVGAVDFCERRYSLAATLVLALAAFNLTFRIGSEVVTEWDESLYALSAWEMARSGNWIGTTLLGRLDYYNTKPPLNTWLVALAFTIVGVNLVALRLASVIAAWSTVFVLQWWVRRWFGGATAILSSLILSTMYAFIYVHAGRSANTDAIFSLLILLTVVTLSAIKSNAWHRLWLGPLLAAVFLLRGLAMLMPLAIILVVEFWPGSNQCRRRWRTAAIACVLFVVPVAAWTIARWRLDQWQFLERMIMFDFVERTTKALEGHHGGPLYYLHVLQKYHYDWLVAGAVAWLLFRPRSWPSCDRRTKLLLATWAAVTLLVPTVMQTKVPWYLNPFYPVFAVVVGWLIVHGLSFAVTTGSGSVRRVALVTILVLAVGTAEGRLIWYSYHHRDLGRSVQGLLIAEERRMRHRSVFRNHWNLPDRFVLEALVGGMPRLAPDLKHFLSAAEAGDYFVSSEAIQDIDIVLVSSTSRGHLYRRR